MQSRKNQTKIQKKKIYKINKNKKFSEDNQCQCETKSGSSSCQCQRMSVPDKVTIYLMSESDKVRVR